MSSHFRETRRTPTRMPVGRSPFASAWWRWLQSKMEGTSWTMSNNYFKSPTGKVVTQWPYGNLQYRLMTKLLGRISESTRERA